MKSFYPPLIICLVPSNMWQNVKNDLSFELIQQKFDDSYRRLIKGAGRAQERARLFSLYDQLKRFTPMMTKEKADVHSDASPSMDGSHDVFAGKHDHLGKENGIESIHIDPEIIFSWTQLLSTLAKLHAKAAVRSGAPDGTPPFLPCIWAPPQADNPHIQPSCRTITGSHLSFLEKMIQTSQFKETALKILDYRRKIFKIATNKNMGVIEYTGDLFD